ncbi:MAG TPA: NfeD family protein [Cyclobacteriaceae bacterium]|nr:NfeD family protein [Cyclobacteriaceae bacterium]
MTLRIVCLLIVCWLSAAFLVARDTPAQNGKKKVMVMEIKAEIDPRMNRYVELALAHATEINADYVVVELDTYGGTLTDAKEITQKIMDFKKPVWVFINSDAASAGALISIACDSIYMSPGASIGAATVVSGGDGSAAPDKYQSYMRSIMRSTAEENGRNPTIAEGMVDEKIVIDSVKQAGKVITLTTTEAIALGYCEGKVTSIAEILEKNKVGEYDIETFRLGFTEKIIAFVLNPFVSGILILVIIAGIYFEMQAPGIGFPLFAAITALVLYLVPYYLNGLAAYWEVIALFIGVGLLAAEIFVIPGFGIAGISGIILTIGSLVLIMLRNDFFNFEYIPLGDITIALFSAVGGIGGGLLLLIVLGARLTDTAAFKRLALSDTQDSSQGYSVSAHPVTMTGKKGTAHTVLRPSGRVMIDNQIYDAFTRGEYIERGEQVEVISTEGVALKVKKI